MRQRLSRLSITAEQPLSSGNTSVRPLWLEWEVHHTLHKPAAGSAGGGERAVYLLISSLRHSSFLYLLMIPSSQFIDVNTNP